MSTRATYLLPASSWNNLNVCFYIHHDGYPEGACYYFLNMHNYKNSHQNYAERFFRANERAEFTINHEFQGDTEYFYTLKSDGNLIVQNRRALAEEITTIFEGQWYEFVNKYAQGKEKLYFFKWPDSTRGGVIMTINEARAKVALEVESANLMLEDGWTGLSESILKKVELIKEQINTFMQTEKPSLSKSG